jgi:hypothetical protein
VFRVVKYDRSNILRFVWLSGADANARLQAHTQDHSNPQAQYHNNPRTQDHAKSQAQEIHQRTTAQGIYHGRFPVHQREAYNYQSCCERRRALCHCMRVLVAHN